jgi:hypothetical protein
VEIGIGCSAGTIAWSVFSCRRCLLHSFHSQRLLFLYCSLVSPVISCFLLRSTGKFMWKYGEVHMSVLGSAPICTGKFTSCVRGSSSWIIVFRSPVLHKRTGKFTQNGFKRSWASVRGSSRTILRGWCTGKFTSRKIGQKDRTGKFTLAEASNATLRRVVQ